MFIFQAVFCLTNVGFISHDMTVFDTAVVDTAVVDTAVVDTAVVDTAVVDTTVVDTAVVDQMNDTRQADLLTPAALSRLTSNLRRAMSRISQTPAHFHQPEGPVLETQCELLS